MSNSKASTFAETMRFGVELRMHVTFTRAASGAPRHRTIADTCARARPNADDARGVKAKTFVLESFVGPSGPSCLAAEGFWPAAG